MTEIKAIAAHTIQINSKDHSWGIFCFDELGNLFLNSDWGAFMYSWRSFGSDFREFLASTNPDYVVGKFAINFREHARKSMPPHTTSAVTGLVGLLIEHLKENPQTRPEPFEITTTGRGFRIIRFPEKNGNICTMQKSSAAMVDAIWLGSETIGIKKFTPGETDWQDLTEFDEPANDGVSYIANNRMELTRDQVERLLPYLQRFVETGEIEQPNGKV